MKFDDTVWKRWVEEWLPLIKRDLQQTVEDQAVFRAFRTMVVENAEWLDSFEGSYFCHFVSRSYLARVALGVRRHVKAHRNGISLMRLLEQIANCSTQITYGHYLVYFPLKPNGPPWQQFTFGPLSKGGEPSREKIVEGDTLSREIIEADMKKLRDLSSNIEQFADKVVAHIDPNGFEGNMAWGEIETAVDQFNETACRYIALLTSDGYGTLEPSILINWTRVFDNPMRKPPGAVIQAEEQDDE